MTPIFLVKDFASALREVVKDFKFVVETQEVMPVDAPKPTRPVAVYEHYLPADLFESDRFFPCVLVSLVSVEPFDIEFRLATLGLKLVTFGGDETDGFQGMRDMFNMAERICQFIDSTPILAQKYPLGIGATFVPADEQKIPWFEGYIEAKYKLHCDINII